MKRQWHRLHFDFNIKKLCKKIVNANLLFFIDLIDSFESAF